MQKIISFFKRRIGNKGLSLVELIISVAMLSVIMIAVLAFMVYGNKIFAGTSADTDVQREAEMVATQMVNYIVNVNGSLGGEYNEEDGSGFTATSYDGDEEVKIDYTWDAETKILSGYDHSSDQEFIIAENVSSFKVIVNSSERADAVTAATATCVDTVVISIVCEDSNETSVYTSEQTITLRNEVLYTGAKTSYTLGDVFADGNVNAIDAQLIIEYVSGQGTLTDAQLLAADVNRDGKVNATDLNLLNMYVNGVITSF